MNTVNRIALLTLTITAVLATQPAAHAQSQPPQCAYFIYTAQDYAFIQNNAYTSTMNHLLQLTPDWNDPNVCSGYELSSTAPQSLSSIGNNMINASDSTFTAFIWDAASAWRITPLAVEPYTPGQGTAAGSSDAAELPIIIATTRPEPAVELEPLPEYEDPSTFADPNDDTPTVDSYQDTIAEDAYADEAHADAYAEDAYAGDHYEDAALADADYADETHEAPYVDNYDDATADTYTDVHIETYEDPYADDTYLDPYDDTVIDTAEETQPQTHEASHQHNDTAFTEAHNETTTLETNYDTPTHDTATDASDATLEAAWAALENHDYEHAAQLFTALTQRDINNVRAHDGLARARVAQGAYTSATIALQIAQSIEPDNYTINTNLGNLLIQTGKHREAITTLEHAIEISTPNTEQLARTHAQLALALERSGNPAEAAAEYDKAFTLHNDPSHKLRYFHALVTAGESTSVIPELLTYAQDNPTVDLHLLAANIYHDLGDHPSRDHQLHLAVQHASTPSEEARALMQQAAFNMDDAEALTQYEAAAALNPSLWEAHYNAGVIALNNYQAGAAVNHLQQAAALTTDLSVQAALARAHLMNHNADAALTQAQAALSSSVTEIRNHATITAIHATYQLGRYADTLQLRAELTDNTDVDTLIMLGMSNYYTGNYNAAANDLQAAFALRPSSSLKRALAYAYLAAYQAQSALPLLQDLTNEYPNDGELQHALGWAFQMTNNTIDSQLAFRRAAALGY